MRSCLVEFIKILQKRSSVCISISIFIIIGILSTVVFITLGTFLVVCSPFPDHLDIVVTFSDETERIEYSREIIKKYSDVFWVWSGSKQTKELYYARTEGENNNTTSIVFVDSCKNTCSEMQFLNRWLEAAWADSVFKEKIVKKTPDNKVNIGFVSSPYHMRRIQLLSLFYLKKKTVRQFFLPVPLNKSVYNYSFFKYWWTKKYSRSLILLEYFKMMNNFLQWVGILKN